MIQMTDLNQTQQQKMENLINLLRSGEIIAYPTESCFGLGCDPDNLAAVTTLVKLKKRTLDKGMIIVADSYQQLLPYIDDNILIDEVRTKIFSVWPGFITWTIPTAPTTPYWLTGTFKTIAVRISAHPTIRLICQMFGKPITSTSANVSGASPCLTVKSIHDQFGAIIPIFPGSIGTDSKPSEIRDALTNRRIR